VTDDRDVEAIAVGAAVDKCRERLDELDTTLIGVIAERMELCVQIAEFKHRGRIPMMQPHRLQHVRAKSVKEGRMQGLDEGFVDRLIDVITQESCRLEDYIIDRLGLGSPNDLKSKRAGPPA
jgi:chorismate mutase-like protein